MGRKSRAEIAARGTVADPSRRDVAGCGGDMNHEALKSAKLVGVMPEEMAREVRASGSVPFTFKSAIILAVSVLLGAIVIPFFMSRIGVAIGTSTTISLPFLTAGALGCTRYFIDSERGFCKGFYLTLLVTFVATALACWLLFYKGSMV